VETQVPMEGVFTAPPQRPPDLTIEVRSRLLHQGNNKLLLILSVATLTLVPTISEFTFAQEVTIRDRDGFVLAADTMQGRFLHYFGLGIWGVNAALDFLVRDKDEQITGGQAQREFSQDFYRQISQLAFDAHMRARVLRGFGGS
jgi:hypothetical protein